MIEAQDQISVGKATLRWCLEAYVSRHKRVTRDMRCIRLHKGDERSSGSTTFTLFHSRRAYLSLSLSLSLSRCGLNFVVPLQKKSLDLVLNGTSWSTRPLIGRTDSRLRPRLEPLLQPVTSSHICKCSETFLAGMPTALCLSNCCNMSGPEFF